MSLILVVGVALFATGVSPWVAPAAALLSLTLGIGQRTSWTFAFASGVILELAAATLLVRLAPIWPGSLTVGGAIALSVLGGAGIIALSRAREPRLLHGHALWIGVSVGAAIAAVVTVLILLAEPGANFEWAMRNDAVWNLVTTRLMIEDGGVTASRPNASPLTPGMLAIVAAVGREYVAQQDLLEHDVTRFAAFWLVAAFTSAVLSALIGLRAARGGAVWTLVVAAAITGGIPLTWFAFGFASQYGFYNATLSLVALLATWLVWMEARRTPGLAIAMLSVATVALLATWAPLAIIPFALALVSFAQTGLALLRSGAGIGTVARLALGLVPVPLYVLLVTLPDLARDGGALGVDGAIMPLMPVHALTIIIVTVCVAALNARPRGQVHLMVGVLVVTVSGSFAGAYLVAQRVGSASLWGYYPAKFAWLVVTLLLVILASAIASEVASLRGRSWAAAGIAVLAVAVPSVLMVPLPPPPGVSGIFAPLAIARSSGIAAGSPAASHLFSLANPGHPTVVIDYASPEVDQFINGWLLQLESTTASDPVRLYSYILSAGDEEQTCLAVRAWDRKVRIVTSDPELPKRFADECSGADFFFEVVESPQGSF